MSAIWTWLFAPALFDLKKGKAFLWILCKSVLGHKVGLLIMTKPDIWLYDPASGGIRLPVAVKGD